MLPFLEVARLPPSSSFYAAILQPLGLQYLSAATEACGPSITFGDANTGVPVLQIRQVTPSSTRPPKRSRISIAAPSATAVGDSCRLALTSLGGGDLEAEAEAETATDGGGATAGHSDHTGQAPHPSAVLRHPPETETDATEATITDIDGNMMDVIYHPYPSHSQFDGPTLRKTQSTTKEATRILDWNFDVASSNKPSVASVPRSSLDIVRRPGHDRNSLVRLDLDEPDNYSVASHSFPGDRIFRRCITTTTTTSVPDSPAATPESSQRGSGGLATGTVVSAFLGAAVGVAAGAAVTYGAMRGERARAFRPEVDATPAFSRRSTFPEAYGNGGRFVEVERRIEKVRFPEDYAHQNQQVRGRPPPPAYIASYSQAPPLYQEPKEIKEASDPYEDTRSRHSSRSRASMGFRTRTRAPSESGSAKHAQPLLLTEAEHRSHVGSSKGSKYPPIVQRSYSYDVPEGGEGRESNDRNRGRSRSRSGSVSASASGSYVSARSHHSSSTIRAVPAPVPAPVPASTPVAVAPAPIRAHGYRSARETPLPPSRVGSSHLSARRVPLPASTVGSRRWEDDDDGDDDSIMPSDSISNVGSQRSRRSRYY